MKSRDKNGVGDRDSQRLSRGAHLLSKIFLLHPAQGKRSRVRSRGHVCTTTKQTLFSLALTLPLFVQHAAQLISHRPQFRLSLHPCPSACTVSLSTPAAPLPPPCAGAAQLLASPTELGHTTSTLAVLGPALGPEGLVPGDKQRDAGSRDLWAGEADISVSGRCAPLKRRG